MCIRDRFNTIRKPDDRDRNSLFSGRPGLPDVHAARRIHHGRQLSSANGSPSPAHRLASRPCAMARGNRIKPCPDGVGISDESLLLKRDLCLRLPLPAVPGNHASAVRSRSSNGAAERCSPGRLGNPEVHRASPAAANCTEPSVACPASFFLTSAVNSARESAWPLFQSPACRPGQEPIPADFVFSVGWL